MAGEKTGGAKDFFMGALKVALGVFLAMVILQVINALFLENAVAKLKANLDGDEDDQE